MAGHVVSIDINGQRYSIRSELDPEYVVRLATYVDDKIRKAIPRPSDPKIFASGEGDEIPILAHMDQRRPKGRLFVELIVVELDERLAEMDGEPCSDGCVTNRHAEEERAD